jgi:hypothetical protein
VSTYTQRTAGRAASARDGANESPGLEESYGVGWPGPEENDGALSDSSRTVGALARTKVVARANSQLQKKNE